MPDGGGPQLDQDNSSEEEKKDDGIKPEVDDVTDEEKSPEDASEDSAESQEDEDDQIGVQEVQQEVHDAASAQASDVIDEDGGTETDITHDVDSFSNKIDDVLQDAGLTRKHMYFCCGGVFVLVMLFVIIFFGVRFFVGITDGDEDSDIDSDVDVVIEVPDTSDEVSTTPEDQVWVDGSLYGGILLGTDTGLEGQTGATEGIDVGEVVNTYDDEFSYQIEHYGKVVNALEVDVNDYLNDFQDRAAAVDGLLVELDDLYEEGKEIIADLEYEIADLEATFEGNLDPKQLYEEEFFAELTAQDGDDAVEALTAFVEISQEQVDIKAHYQARQKLYELLYSALLYLNARIDDITLNREALVKGVQVVDVIGSDLELIVEEELE